MKLKDLVNGEVGRGRVQPKNKGELLEIIEETIASEGPNCDLNFIDVSKITDMGELFAYSKFDGDISKWDVSNVGNMGRMFWDSKFNGDISKWDVSNVKYMNRMFAHSKFFNGDISKWDVSNVENMENMFNSSKFNGDISKWDVSNVRDMYRMFKDAGRKYSLEDIKDWKINGALLDYFKSGKYEQYMF